MAVSLVSGQSATSYVEGPGSLTISFPGDVTDGNLLVVTGFTFRTGTTAWTASHVSKSSGTATIGTVTVDSQSYRNNGFGEYYGAVSFSVPVTGSGSLTLLITQPNADFGEWVIREYTDADTTGTRVEDTAVATGSAANASSGDATSAGGALFIGAFGAVTGGTVTPDSAFTEIVERESWVVGSIVEQIVTSGTTDAASWTSPSGDWGAIVVVYKAAGGGGTNHTLNLSDSAGTSEAFPRSTTKPLSDSGAAAESRVYAMTRPLADSGAAADTKALNPTKVLTDSASTSEQRLVAVGKILADSSTVAEVIAKATTLAALLDSAAASDTIEVVRAILLALTDSATVADTRTALAGKTLSDSAAAADSRTMALVRSMIESVAAADTLTRAVAFVRALSDSATTAEVFAAVKAILLALSDSASASDVLTALQILSLALTDSVAATEARPAFAVARSLVEQVVIAEIRTALLQRIFSDTMGASDPTVAFGHGRTLLDAATASDLGIAKALGKLLADAASAAEADRVVSMARALLDIAVAADEITATLLQPYVTPSSRILSVAAELRLFVVEQETRTVTVAAESRIEEVEA